MNITSVQGQDLYKIIAGNSYDDDYKKVTNEELAKHGFTKVGNFDRFELSKKSTDPSKIQDGVDVSSIESILSDTSGRINLVLIKAKVNGGNLNVVNGFSTTLSENEIASYIGGIGKRIDEAYAGGKFTEDEYNQLNDSLKEYAEAVTAANERAIASWTIVGENMKERSMLMKNGIQPAKDNEERPFEDRIAAKRAEMNERINNYIKNVFSFDRSRLWDLINLFRYSK